MSQVEVERVIRHPVERVFRRYTDHEGWSRWAGLGRVKIAREGAPERDGEGCVRTFSAARSLREEVVLFEPFARMDYRVVAGAYPLADHHAEVRFAPEDGATRVTWRVAFRSRIPGTGWLIELGLAALFRRILSALARDLDARP